MTLSPIHKLSKLPMFILKEVKNKNKFHEYKQYNTKIRLELFFSLKNWDMSSLGKNGYRLA